MAIISNNIYFIIWSIYLYNLNISQKNNNHIIYEVVLILWWLGTFTLWIKLICVYLAFTFARITYNKISGKFHNKCNKYCELLAKNKLRRQLEIENDDFYSRL